MARSTRPTPATLAAWEALLVAHARLLPRLDADLQRAEGLSLEWYDVIHQLRESGGTLTMGQLSDRLLVGASRCSRRVDRMAEAGLVERHRDEVDARVINVGLTADGRAAGRRAGVTHLRSIQHHVGRVLDDETADVVSRALTALAAEPARPESG